ncbi:MAG: Gfo/Idh/MocA family protein [Syntrophobacteraceae bacterium]
MFKVCIIGCGKQADVHVGPISLMSECEIVGVCDREILMAGQLAERYSIKRYFTNVEKMLEETRPNVVHVITPPHSHPAIGKTCLDAGCNIFFEKPFCLDTDAARSLINLADSKGLRITVGHNNRFSNSASAMRKLIQEGYIGTVTVHMDSIWCYDLGDQAFAKALLSDKNHWVRSLPGKLLHNIINHGIGRIAEHLKDGNIKVIAHGFKSTQLEKLGENDLIDELRVIIQSDQTTAYFTFSTQMRPLISTFRISGDKGSLVLDDMHQTLVKVERTNYVSLLNYLYPPVAYGRQYIQSGARNLMNVARNKMHYDKGRRVLIEAFYQSIKNNTSVPIPYDEILRTSFIMDQIFKQIYPALII